MIRGALALLSGFRLLLARQELRSVVWRMLGLLLILAVVIGAGSLMFLDWLIEAYVPQADAWYWQALGWVIGVFAWLLALVVAIVAFATLGSIAAAPWLDTLCARVEGLHRVEGGEAELPWWKSVLSSAGNAVMPLLQFLPWAAAALLLLAVPVVGAVLAGVMWAYGGIRLLAFELMDAPASRRGWDWRQRKSEFDGQRWFYVGYAGLASAMLLVPAVNLLVLPAAVAGLADAWHRQTGAAAAR